MVQEYKVAVLVGSLSRNSYNRKIAEEMIRLAPQGLQLEFVEIGDLAFYTPDLEEAVPAAWQKFRDRIKQADALLFVTPEYNRSVPAVLKNAIDVGSRPFGHGVWNGKPGAVASASPGAIGGFGANHHLRQSLVSVDVAVMPQPECYISHVNQAFDEAGKLSERTEKFLASFLQAYAAWVKKQLG